jgi:hypothetical protein
MLGATGIKPTTSWRCCSCDLGLLGETQFGPTVVCHLRKKNHVFHVLMKTAVMSYTYNTKVGISKKKQV